MRLPRSTQNWTTLVGATIAVIALFMIGFLFGLSIILREGHAYLGLVTFILLPAIMIMGLILIPIGMMLEIRREKRLGIRASGAWPKVDLNDYQHRNAFFIFAGGTTLLLFLSSLGSYEAFEFTESNTFCGQVCHKVMSPVYTAYQHSPHARVACVGCHVGPGAGWYVRSKLSGLYQVYAVLTKRYPVPIPTPIENLRPAREVCEQCHWPQKFYSQSVRLISYYLPDQDNSQWNVYLLMKVGAEHSAMGFTEGIHWHINPDVHIEYIASDRTRTALPWVRYTNRGTGEVVVFEDQDSPLTAEQVRNGKIRTMDCIDCHNRPSHSYRAPLVFINEAMTAGTIPKELPDIKSVAVEICAAEHADTPAAMRAIEQTIDAYYRDKYPEVYSGRKNQVEQAIAGLQKVFSQNIFPEMKVRWSAYPNHIGHTEFNGCFRCHNDRHVSQDNRKISRDCNLCHIINAQGPPGNLERGGAGQALEFKHPEDIGEMWKEMLCADCHTGAKP